MRTRIFTLLLLITGTMGVSGQKVLDFNQIHTFPGKLYYGNFSSPLWIVPPQKAWKIEAMTSKSDYFVPSGTAIRTYFSLNGVVIKQYLNTATASNTYPVLQETFMPMWLKSGDSIRFHVSPNAQWPFATDTIGYYLSVIEYDISQ